jgi:sensor c-di-GMP phosphodiesterase-like protein
MLGMTVVAEGIENAAQRDRLRAMGCDLGQGYLFSRPVAPNRIRSLVAAIGSGRSRRTGSQRSGRIRTQLPKSVPEAPAFGA